jgi:hypothetical protein
LATLAVRRASQFPIRDFAAPPGESELVRGQIRQFAEFDFGNGVAVYCAGEEIG